MENWNLPLPFGYSLDLSFWNSLLSLPTGELIPALFAIFGWVVLFLIFFEMGEHLWLHYRQEKYKHKWQWVVLAVDVPPLFIQTPKAVEQIFAHLSGAITNPHIGEKYWLGKKQKYFSMEIVSIEGYIQFLIRTEIEFRDLVEAAVYAQYPEAEITEVEDYVNLIPSHYPDPEYDVFGVEFTLKHSNPYPIRTYPSFEYSLSKDVVFSDPMAALLENFSRIGHGENLWYQIVVEPINNHWREEGVELVKKIIANKKEHHESVIGTFIGDIWITILHDLQSIMHWTFEPMESHHEEAPAGKVMDLSPGMKTTLEKIEEKIAKIGFKTKINILYSARKEVYHPGRCIDGIVGAMKQYSVMGSNAIVPYSDTTAHYAFKDYLVNMKKNKLVKAYKKRKIKIGGSPFILNIEELATIWHFPLPFVKTPLVQKTSAKRAEPPMGLPVESTESPLRKILQLPTTKVETPPPPAPPQYG
ncbi:MAG: hypothetical protein Q7S66_01690 [bacterium]|nr:hypothetical protein [bacterium]